jgi:hypothetical protein
MFIRNDAIDFAAHCGFPIRAPRQNRWSKGVLISPAVPAIRFSGLVPRKVAIHQPEHRHEDSNRQTIPNLLETREKKTKWLTTDTQIPPEPQIPQIPICSRFRGIS